MHQRVWAARSGQNDNRPTHFTLTNTGGNTNMKQLLKLTTVMLAVLQRFGTITQVSAD